MAQSKKNPSSKKPAPSSLTKRDEWILLKKLGNRSAKSVCQPKIEDGTFSFKNGKKGELITLDLDNDTLRHGTANIARLLRKVSNCRTDQGYIKDLENHLNEDGKFIDGPEYRRAQQKKRREEETKQLKKKTTDDGAIYVPPPRRSGRSRAPKQREVDPNDPLDMQVVAAGGYRVLIDPDGNCLFVSVGDQTGHRGQVLRNVACSYLETNKQEYVGVWFEDENEFDNHLKYMRKPGKPNDRRTWGGNHECKALGKSLKRNIFIFQQPKPLALIYNRSWNTIYLAYDGIHFESVRGVKDEFLEEYLAKNPEALEGLDEESVEADRVGGTESPGESVDLAVEDTETSSKPVVSDAVGDLAVEDTETSSKSVEADAVGDLLVEDTETSSESSLELVGAEADPAVGTKSRRESVDLVVDDTEASSKSHRESVKFNPEELTREESAKFTPDTAMVSTPATKKHQEMSTPDTDDRLAQVTLKMNKLRIRSEKKTVSWREAVHLGKEAEERGKAAVARDKAADAHKEAAATFKSIGKGLDDDLENVDEIEDMYLKTPVKKRKSFQTMIFSQMDAEDDEDSAEG